MYDVIIIGGGPAGLTGAIYARRAGMSALVLESTMCGGQIVNSESVANFPSRENVPGWQLADDWQKQAINLGAEIKFSSVTGIDVTEQKTKLVHTPKGSFEAKTVIIANGANPRKLECPGAQRFYGRGISICATCDGAFFKGQEVCVVGGGNTAFDDAVYLSSICSKVYLINRRAQFRASAAAINNASSKPNIEILVPYIPYEVVGDMSVKGFKIKNTETEEIRELPVAGIFTAIGMVPANDAFANVVTLDESGYIVTDEDCRTGTFGIFAAGDTRKKSLKQLVTAASDGAIAATQAAAIVNSWEA